MTKYVIGADLRMSAAKKDISGEPSLKTLLKEDITIQRIMILAMIATLLLVVYIAFQAADLYASAYELVTQNCAVGSSLWQ